jgi:hypothetical protein
MNRIDYKFLVPLIVAAAGIVAPILLWYADLASKALVLQHISTNQLNPPANKGRFALEVTLDGRVVRAPALSTLALVNTGTRAINQQDFEAALEITVSDPVTILRAEVSEAEPPDLRPTLQASDAKVTVQPLLLNPGDRILIAVLTAGGTPTFAARARISGVPRVVTTNVAQIRSEKMRLASSAIGVSLLTIYMVVLTDFIVLARARILRMSWLAAAIVCHLGGTILIAAPFEQPSISLPKFFQHFGIAILLSLIAQYVRPKRCSAS